MEFHQLRYFIAVAEEGSFSRAAERVHVAQPSLSQQIQKLESELGQALFDRLPRRVLLTEAGRALLPFARRILNEIADARHSLDDSDGKISGTVRVGLIPTIAPFVLEPLLAAAEQSGIRLEIQEDVTENLVRELENGERDLAILSDCRRTPGIHLERLAMEPLAAAVPASHRLASAGRIGWRHLRGERILTMHEAHCLSRQVRRACAAHGLSPAPELPLLQISTLLVLVAAGQGISLLPAMARGHIAGTGCVLLPFRVQGPSRAINLARNYARYHGKAAAVIAGLVRRCVAELIAPARA